MAIQQDNPDKGLLMIGAEQREREERARAFAKKLKHDAEQVKQAEQ